MIEDERVQATYDSVEVGEHLGPITYEVDEETARLARKSSDGAGGLLLADGRAAMPPSIAMGDYTKLIESKYSTYDMVQAKTAHEFLKAVVTPVTLSVRGRIADKYLRRGREYIVVEATTEDESGDCVAQTRVTLLVNASRRRDETGGR